MRSTNEIIVDTGKKTYVVKDSSGCQIGTFSFNPGDLDIIRRHEEVVTYLEEMSQHDFEGGNDEILQLEDELKEKIDYLFGANVSDAFFSNTSPLAPLQSGQLYIENVMNVLAEVIEKELGVRVDRMAERLGIKTDDVLTQ